MDGCTVSMRTYVGNVQDLSPADVRALQVAVCIAVKTTHIPSGPKHTLSLNQLYDHSSPLAYGHQGLGLGWGKGCNPRK